ncbi:MAG: T9SS type A sorting domain-containing protein [Fibromonadales bacterium]|nr:T9SS type A sorting domain-containing protein [Fibromonadales bacterium]
MKKVLALSLFAMVAWVYAKPCATGGVALLCQWQSGGKCWQIKSTDESNNEIGCATQVANCESGGTLYKGPEASDGSCSGGGRAPFTCGGCSLEEEASIYCDYGPLLPDGTGGCYEKPVGQCSGGREVTKQQCDDRMNAGVNNNAKLCYWPANADNNNTCYCGLVQGGEATEANCANEYGEIVTSCDGKCSSTPVIKFTPASTAFLVATSGRSLHISSAKDATVSLYDMNGAKVYSGKVRAGNSVFSLEKVAVGSYYAVVQSGSDAKKVPVVLK